MLSKKLKSLAALIIVAGAGFLTGCAEANAADFYGDWTLVSVEGKEDADTEDFSAIIDEGVSIGLEVHGNGSAYLTVMGEKEEGTWEIKGSKAVFTLGKDDALGTIKDDTLILAAKDGKMTFERGRAPSPVAETELEEVAEEPVEEVPEEGAGEEG